MERSILIISPEEGMHEAGLFRRRVENCRQGKRVSSCITIPPRAHNRQVDVDDDMMFREYNVFGRYRSVLVVMEGSRPK